MHPAETAADRFFAFIQDWPTPGKRPEPRTWLHDNFVAWMDSGDGIEAVNGDFLVFMQTMLVVVHRLYKDPSLLDYKYVTDSGKRRTVSRRLGSILGEGGLSGLSVVRKAFDNYAVRHRNRRRY